VKVGGGEVTVRNWLSVVPDAAWNQCAIGLIRRNEV